MGARPTEPTTPTYVHKQTQIVACIHYSENKNTIIAMGVACTKQEVVNYLKLILIFIDRAAELHKDSLMC